MNTKTAQLVVACFLGAFVGTLVALEVAGHFWWLGTLVGALTAYLGCGWREVITAIPRAFRKVVTWRSTLDFRAALLYGFYTMIIASGVIPLMLLIGVVGDLEAPVTVSQSVINSLVVSVFWCSLVFVAFFGVTLRINQSPEAAKEVREKIPTLRKAAWRYNALTTPFIVVYFVLWVCVWVLKRLPTAAGRLPTAAGAVVWGIASFCGLLFLIIHSGRRLTCAAAGATGTAIGYAAGSASVGGLSGALIGLVAYEFVAKRLLKTATANAHA